MNKKIRNIEIEEIAMEIANSDNGIPIIYGIDNIIIFARRVLNSSVLISGELCSHCNTVMVKKKYYRGNNTYNYTCPECKFNTFRTKKRRLV